MKYLPKNYAESNISVSLVSKVNEVSLQLRDKFLKGLYNIHLEFVKMLKNKLANTDLAEQFNNSIKKFKTIQ